MFCPCVHWHKTETGELLALRRLFSSRRDKVYHHWCLWKANVPRCWSMVRYVSPGYGGRLSSLYCGGKGLNSPSFATWNRMILLYFTSVILWNPICKHQRDKPASRWTIFIYSLCHTYSLALCSNCTYSGSNSGGKNFLSFFITKE